MAVMPEILGYRRMRGFKEFIAVGYQISQAVVKARVRKTLKVLFWSA